MSKEHMSERTEHRASRPWKITRLIALALVPIALAGCVVESPTAPTTPIPSGHVEIHVEFKNLSTSDYNKLTAFVRELPKEPNAIFKDSESVRAVGDYNAYHGFGNDGYVDQRYNPEHQVPSPEVEKAMRTRLETFLKENGIEADRAKLELRYGK